MDDIKIPEEELEDDDVEEQPEVDDLDMEDDLPGLDEELEQDVVSEDEPASRVKITFGRFVKLVANHSFLDIVERNADQEIIISTNLLTDLANAHDGQNERKLPIVFILGIVIGVAVTYFLLAR